VTGSARLIWAAHDHFFYTDMIDTNAKLQDVVHLDNIDDEIDTTFAGDRIAQEKKLLRKIDMRMMPMMMLICTFYSSS
jgi:alpha-glucuronidase